MRKIDKINPSPYPLPQGARDSVRLNVLVVGSGAREHAIADAVLKSPLLNKLYLADANDGFKNLGEQIEYNDYEDLAQKGVNVNLDLVIIGSEEPLCKGIVDTFGKYDISCIGVNQKFSQLESSKFLAKGFMEKYSIKTPKFRLVDKNTKVSTLYKYFDDFTFPLVIKANGLCKGKGVKIVWDKDVALNTIVQYLNGKFGESSQTILLEEFIKGEELSLMSLFDGETLLHFPPTRDFKKLDDSVDAPNTGGMGAFCPVDLTNEQKEKLEIYKKQLQCSLVAENADFLGFIYSGLIWSEKYQDWYVLEYNVRLGDPETQAILTHLESDFLEILKDTKGKCLSQWITPHPEFQALVPRAEIHPSLTRFAAPTGSHASLLLSGSLCPTRGEGEKALKFKENYSACLVIACEGYPEKPKDGEKITIPESHHCEQSRVGLLTHHQEVDLALDTSHNQEVKLFYAGVELKDGELYSKGGRVLSLCANAKNPFPILKDFADKIEMNNKYYRADINLS